MSNVHGQNLKFSPARAPSYPHIWTNPDVGSPYLEKLLEEKKKLAYYVPGLPVCNKLPDQEILRVAEMIPNQGFNGFDRLQLGSPNPPNPMNMMPGVTAMKFGHWDGYSAWSPLQHQGYGGQPGTPINHGSASSSSLSSLMTKKMLCLDVPVDKYPNFNFVGRLLGRNGNYMKRIQALTGCRVFIRGRGSMKDRDKEERLRGKAGHGHLNEPLHIIIEAESPANVVDEQLSKARTIIEELLKPVNKDVCKRQQLQEPSEKAPLSLVAVLVQ